jgi:hypothetical protein
MGCANRLYMNERIRGLRALLVAAGGEDELVAARGKDEMNARLM